MSKIMGMNFAPGTEPDFGSIRATKLTEGSAKVKGINEYVLYSDDVAKLDNITNAACGSTAFCVDTADMYVLMDDGWSKVGGDGE